MNTSGAIRIYLGDCLQVMAEIPSGSVDMILADLPYQSTACAWDSAIPLPPLWAEYERVAKPGAAIVLTAMQPFTSALVMSKPDWFRVEWVWDKRVTTGAVHAKRHPLRAHEAVLVFSKEATTYNPQMIERPEDEVKRLARSGSVKNARLGTVEVRQHQIKDRDQRQMKYPSTVIRIGGLNGCHPERVGHPTQKPVALMEYLVKTYSNEGDTVLDNCMGSGSCGVAAINTGRKFIGIEKDPEYFAVAKNRLYTTSPEGEPTGAFYDEETGTYGLT